MSATIDTDTVRRHYEGNTPGRAVMPMSRGEESSLFRGRIRGAVYRVSTNRKDTANTTQMSHALPP